MNFKGNISLNARPLSDELQPYRVPVADIPPEGKPQDATTRGSGPKIPDADLMTEKQVWQQKKT